MNLFILCHWHVMFWVYNYNLITTLVLMSDFLFLIWKQWMWGCVLRRCEVMYWAEGVRLCTEERVWGCVLRRGCEVMYWGEGVRLCTDERMWGYVLRRGCEVYWGDCKHYISHPWQKPQHCHFHWLKCTDCQNPHQSDGFKFLFKNYMM